MKYYFKVAILLFLSSCVTDKNKLNNKEKSNNNLLNCEFLVPDIFEENNVYDIRKIELKKLVEIDSTFYNKNSTIFTDGIKAYHYSYLNEKCNLVLCVSDKVNGSKSLWLFKIDNSGIIGDKLLLSEESSYPEFNSIKYTIKSGNKIFISQIDSYLDDYIDENNYSVIVDSISYEYEFSENLHLSKKDSIRKKLSPVSN